MRKQLLVCFLLVCINVFCQLPDNNKGYLLSYKLGMSFKDYAIKSDRAYFERNFDSAEKLFDSLIVHVVNGSTFDNFKMHKLSGRKIDFYTFKKPVFFMTYASWCTPGSGEIPALNEIANRYYKDIDFVILFWDKKKDVKKIAKQYSKKIHILYIDESENLDDSIIHTLKHTLGFPVSFFINTDKKIVDVRRGVLHPYNESYEISFELNYTAFTKGISLLKNLDKNDSVVIEE